MSDLAAWLETLGLGQYASVFAANDVDLDALPYLSDEELKELGLSLGHRKKLLHAVAASTADRKPADAAAAPKPGPEPQAERRQLTVMFCDLVGSTALSARLDPEDLRAVIGAYHRCAAAVIERAGGFIAKYMGDGVLAYFGYPRADEHDAERAVRAGLALVEAVVKLDPAAGAPLQARVGIATGLVVVGDLIGEGAAQEQAVVGETPNLAARLQALAQPGTVVIAAGTRRLTGGLFDYEDLGPVEIKGLAAPATASRVLRESTAESRFEALRVIATPLVGRDEELALLMRRWQQAKSGEGSVVLVSGEPGIGKSRLAHALIERLAGEPHTRLRTFCSPHHQDHALYPTIAQLERAAGFRREDTPAQRFDKLEAVLAQATDDLGEAAPLLAALLSLPPAERYPPLDLTPQKQKEKTLRALVAQVEGLAVRQPVLMLFEDAHWSDPSSLELLDLIIDRAPTLPLLLIVTYRPEFAAPWTGRPHVSLLALNRLAPRQRIEIIAGVTGGKALPLEIAEQIVDRTDGVPLFVEELTKAVLGERHADRHGRPLYRVRARGALGDPGKLAGLALGPARSPGTGARGGPDRGCARPAVLARADPRSYSHAAAATRRRAGTAGRRRADLPPRRPTQRRIHVQARAGAGRGVRQRSRRQQLHARIAATLEDRFPEIVAAQPALLAHHCEAAGLGEKAAAYWLAAGRHAWAGSATAETVALLRRGLALVPGLPDTDRCRETEFDLQIALGQVTIASRGWAVPELGEAYARARELASTLNRPRAVLSALYGQCTYHAYRGDLTRARQLAAEVRNLGESAGDAATQIIAHIVSGFIYLEQGDFTAARAHYEAGLAQYDPAYRPFFNELLSYDLLSLVLVHSSQLLVSLGDLDQGLSRRDAALQEARRLSHPHNLAHGLSWAWPISRCIGADPQSLLQDADELLALAVEHALGFYWAVGLMKRGWCLSALGHADEGIPLLTTGLAGIRDTGHVLRRPGRLNTFADACRMAGQWQAALGHLAEAHRLAEETGNRCYQAETLRLRGEVLLAMGDRTGAEASYGEALALARRQNARLWELRTAMSLARLWREQGKSTAAHELLAPVYGGFTEGFDTPVLREAKGLLAELGYGLGHTGENRYPSRQ
jgi:class 3 adenylate cyclase/tetratricopeptide (TPR) repeat protein